MSLCRICATNSHHKCQVRTHQNLTLYSCDVILVYVSGTLSRPGRRFRLAAGVAGGALMGPTSPREGRVIAPGIPGCFLEAREGCPQELHRLLCSELRALELLSA